MSLQQGEWKNASLVLLTASLNDSIKDGSINLVSEGMPLYVENFIHNLEEMITTKVKNPTAQRVIKHFLSKREREYKLDNTSFLDFEDPLDILVFSQIDIPPLTLVRANIIGVMRMIDRDEIDDKIIAVATNDMSVNYINDISELPPHTMKEIVRFFQDYKALERKNVTVEQLLDKSYAHKVIEESIALYQDTFVNKTK